MLVLRHTEQFRKHRKGKKKKNVIIITTSYFIARCLIGEKKKHQTTCNSQRAKVTEIPIHKIVLVKH